MDKQSSRPILYQENISPPCRSVMMLAHILKIDLELRKLHPVMREQDTPEFTKKNPMRTVPILEEGNYCLSDSHAINIYLMEKYGAGHRHLYPSDSKIRAKIHERMFFDCGVLFPRLRAILAPTFSGKLIQLTKQIISNVEDAYRILDEFLSEHTYIAGDVMTLADIHVVSTTYDLHGLYPINSKRYPKLYEWLEKMSEKDFFIEVNKPGSVEFVRILKKWMQINGENAKPKL